MKCKIIFSLLTPLLLCSACSVTATQSLKVNDEFLNASFEDKSFIYDGNPHSLEVTGAPEGTDIVYTNNAQTEVGVYTVTAGLSKEGYDSKTLTAKLTITENSFKNVTFSDATFDYDGEIHGLYVTGAPEGTDIVYTNNNQTEVGVYTVTAKLNKRGYKSKTLTAKLTIKGSIFNNAKLESKTFDYDGNPHSLEVTGVPEGTNISYTNNNKIEVGTYTVTAKLTKRGYESKTLSAQLIISDDKSFPNGSFSDLFFIYDNRDINVNNFFESYEYDIQKNYTKDFKVTYKLNGSTKTQLSIKNVGVYDISATYSAIGFKDKTIAFKITISDQIGGVDSTKTPFQFTPDTKYKELFDEVIKGNYTIKSSYRDEYDYDKDGTYETIINSPNVSSFYITPDAAVGRRNEDSANYSSKDFFISKGTDYAFNYQFDYYELSKLKFPISCYNETVIQFSDGMCPFTLLKESESGGFENSKIGGYHDQYGSFVIDTVKNQMVITSRTHYYHNEFNHDEVVEYILCNVGNTKVGIPEALKGNDSLLDSFTTDNFIEKGVEYNLYDNKFVADVTLDEFDNAYLGGSGTCVLRPEIDGTPMTEINYNFYYNRYYVDHSNYQINVYYDNNGYYQGSYSSLGYVKYYLDAKKYGTICYYNKWNE